MKSYLSLTRYSGNEKLFEAVEMAIISMLWGVPLHIHAEGLRGTGKTTIMRAARQIMPPIERIKGCLYNCDPRHPHCPNHRGMSREEIEAIGTEIVPRPFLEISPSAKIGTVVGSIDLARITDPQNPTAALLPGLIPQAHRGVIFVDEINRLADTAPELTDVLLDVMGTKPGRIQIEETGLPVVELPVQVSVWAASNPDEDPGPLQEIRRQLSDRFDFVIDMGRTQDEEAVIRILRQSEIDHKRGFYPYANGEAEDSEEIREYQQRLAHLAEKYRTRTIPDFLRSYIARTYVKYNLESLRAIEAMQHGALLSAALRDADQVLISDVLKVTPWALQHRVDAETLSKILGQPVSGRSLTREGTAAKETAATSEGGRGAFLGMFRSFLGREEEPEAESQAVLPSDTIKGTPQRKARAIDELAPEDLVTTEEELKKQ